MGSRAFEKSARSNGLGSSMICFVKKSENKCNLELIKIKFMSKGFLKLNTVKFTDKERRFDRSTVIFK